MHGCRCRCGYPWVVVGGRVVSTDGCPCGDGCGSWLWDRGCGFFAGVATGGSGRPSLSVATTSLTRTSGWTTLFLWMSTPTTGDGRHPPVLETRTDSTRGGRVRVPHDVLTPVRFGRVPWRTPVSSKGPVGGTDRPRDTRGGQGCGTPGSEPSKCYGPRSSCAPLLFPRTSTGRTSYDGRGVTQEYGTRVTQGYGRRRGGPGMWEPRWTEDVTETLVRVGVSNRRS